VREGKENSSGNIHIPDAPGISDHVDAGSSSYEKKDGEEVMFFFR
jgi:hypothetical protein